MPDEEDGALTPKALADQIADNVAKSAEQTRRINRGMIAERDLQVEAQKNDPAVLNHQENIAHRAQSVSSEAPFLTRERWNEFVDWVDGRIHALERHTGLHKDEPEGGPIGPPSDAPVPPDFSTMTVGTFRKKKRAFVHPAAPPDFSKMKVATLRKKDPPKGLGLELQPPQEHASVDVVAPADKPEKNDETGRPIFNPPDSASPVAQQSVGGGNRQVGGDSSI